MTDMGDAAARSLCLAAVACLCLTVSDVSPNHLDLTVPAVPAEQLEPSSHLDSTVPALPAEQMKPLATEGMVSRRMGNQ